MSCATTKGHLVRHAGGLEKTALFGQKILWKLIEGKSASHKTPARDFSSDTLFPTFLSFLISSEKLSQRKKLVIFFFYFHLQLPSLQASLCFCSTLAKHHLSLKQCGLWSRLLRLFSAKYGRIRAGYIQTLLAHPALKKFPDVLCLCFFPNNIKECQQKWDEVWKPAVQKFSKWVLLCYEDELSSDYSTTFCTPG